MTFEKKIQVNFEEEEIAALKKAADILENLTSKMYEYDCNSLSSEEGYSFEMEKLDEVADDLRYIANAEKIL